MDLRLFIALNLPQDVRNALTSVQAHLSRQNPHIRVNWVNPQIIHLTLHFLGEVAEERLGDLQAVVEQGSAGIGPLHLRLGKLDGFPNTQRPRVIWVGLEEQLHTVGRGLVPRRHAERSLQGRLASRGRGPSAPEQSSVRGGQAPALQGFHSVLRKFLINAGFNADLLPFTPHLTLGRVKVPQVFRGLDSSVGNCQFQVDRVELIESKLYPSGPEYTAVTSVMLKGNTR